MKSLAIFGATLALSVSTLPHVVAQDTDAGAAPSGMLAERVLDDHVHHMMEGMMEVILDAFEKAGVTQKATEDRLIGEIHASIERRLRDDAAFTEVTRRTATLSPDAAAAAAAFYDTQAGREVLAAAYTPPPVSAAEAEALHLHEKELVMAAAEDLMAASGPEADTDHKVGKMLMEMAAAH